MPQQCLLPKAMSVVLGGDKRFIHFLISALLTYRQNHVTCPPLSARHKCLRNDVNSEWLERQKKNLLFFFCLSLTNLFSFPSFFRSSSFPFPPQYLHLFKSRKAIALTSPSLLFTPPSFLHPPDTPLKTDRIQSDLYGFQTNVRTISLNVIKMLIMFDLKP